MIENSTSARVFLILSILVAGVTLILSASQLQAATAKSNYDSKCAMCHAENGSGKTPMGKNMGLRDLRSKGVQKQSNHQLYEIIAKGKGAMPGYSSQLSGAEIDGLVVYVRELAKKK